MRTLKIVFYLVIASVSFSCNKSDTCDCFKSTGSITNEHRTIPGFNAISVSNNINLYITEDTFYSIVVEAGSHILESIKTQVTDSCLYLTNSIKCNWVRSYKDKVNIYVTCKKIKELDDNICSGNIFTTDTLYADKFNMNDFAGSGTINLKLVVSNTSWFSLNTGPIDLTVRGRSGLSYLYSNGNGKADLSNFPTGDFFITNNSTNDCYINVNNWVDAQIGYVGNIYYKGSPTEITTNITGSGQLIKN
jgi:hypothetical protein